MIQCVGGITQKARGAILDPQQTLPLFVERVKQDSPFHKGDSQRSLCCFFDAANISNYTPKKSQVLAFTLPHLRSPHQQSAVRCIGRWRVPDKATDYLDFFGDLSVVAAVEKVCQKNNLIYVWAWD